MKAPGVMLIGSKNGAQTTLASAAVYCAGARIVASAQQRLVERLIAQWAATRKGSRPRPGRTS